ncbi:NAD(P)H-hydrate epimerase [Anaerovirgula multivorans]|uniref:Bifunctional NAD(P)H-hydrate repair enzyme n=1 Tax=Anaerovirgula multivorans TaxID=312168 RepID=A0A239H386_9FIRM|nr:NAD(P)H-hydrate dehydratase [Anaerovirgula multivorans]SNS75936.1 NAD(P)H-hydrate epimerase [Anaerovirgula multivorans]
MKIFSNEEMKNLDRIAIEEYKIPGIILMENAGIAVVKEIVKSLEIKENKRVAILCGLGNNGGDGFVIARHLISYGLGVDTYVIGNTSSIKGDAKINYEILVHLKASITTIKDEEDLAMLEDSLEKCGILVDGILGTGLQRPIEGVIKEVIAIVNKSKKEIIAIDIPSGINGDDGEVYGEAVKANKTITFQLPKIGNILYPGSDYCGKLLIENIGIPKNAIDAIEAKISLITEKMVQALLPKRYSDTHKGSYGKALIIAGSFGMTGAAILASKAALRSGAGIVKTAVPKELSVIIENQLIEAITVSLEELWNQDNQQAFRLKGEDAIAIGPGSGRAEAFKKLLEAVVEEATVPVVIDADGLNLLAENIDILKSLKAPCIITPHPGEMARLTGLSIDEINRNRIDVARGFSLKWKVITLLKGARTIISDEKGNVYINSTGNPGMATAGSGDVLTGMITGLLAQGISPLEATITAAYLHGKAGDRTAEKYGQYSMLAGDILEEIPYGIKELLKF